MTRMWQLGLAGVIAERIGVGARLLLANGRVEPKTEFGRELSEPSTIMRPSRRSKPRQQEFPSGRRIYFITMGITSWSAGPRSHTSD